MSENNKKMTKQIREQVYNKYGGRCAYCGHKITLKEMQVDHIIPKSSMRLIDKRSEL